MKSILPILLFISASAFAQKQTEKEIKTLLCHKWKASEVKAGDQILPIPSGADINFLNIKTDGTFTAGDPNKQKKGKWRYDHKTKTLTTEAEDKVVKHEIIKITKTELRLKTTIEGIVLDINMKRTD
jgi:hypothetical protein